MKKTKKTKLNHWKTCLYCKGKTTKIINITTGKIRCQQCFGEYDMPNDLIKE